MLDVIIPTLIFELFAAGNSFVLGIDTALAVTIAPEISKNIFLLSSGILVSILSSIHGGHSCENRICRIFGHFHFKGLNLPFGNLGFWISA